MRGVTTKFKCPACAVRAKSDRRAGKARWRKIPKLERRRAARLAALARWAKKGQP